MIVKSDMKACLRRAAAALVAVATATATLAFPASARAGILGFGYSDTPPALAAKLGQPVSPTLMATLARASKAGLELKTSPGHFQLTPINGPNPAAGGKVGMLYVGAGFCPYCAGQRWGLALTLLRFGKLDGLRYMLSSARDVYPNTPTVTFAHASYTSPYVDLQAVETQDRKHGNLMTPNPSQRKIYRTFDAPPHVRFAGSIPFVYVGGKYIVKGLTAHPRKLEDRDWKQIAQGLANPDSDLFKAVMPRVNLLTAAICKLDDNKPADICTAPGVVAAAKLLASTNR